MQAAVRSSLVSALLLSGVLAGCLGDSERSDDDRPSAAAAFRALEERPLELPRVDFGGRSVRELGVAGRCVEGGQTEVGALVIPEVGQAALGPWPGLARLERGPVYAVLLDSAPRIAGLAAQPTIGATKAVGTIWLSRPEYDGPVLVRGGRIDRPGELGFGSRLEPQTKLRLPAGTWPHGDTGAAVRPKALREGWRASSIPTRVRSPGCYAFQVDGLGFSYVLAFGAQPQV